MSDDTAEPLFPLTDIATPAIVVYGPGDEKISLSDPRCEAIGIRRCSTCRKLKLLSEYTNGYLLCRPCHREYQAERRLTPGIRERDYANQKRRYVADGGRSQRDRQLRSSWGWSLEAYEEMKRAQGGVCAICGQPETAVYQRRDRLEPTKLDLAIDHDHSHDWAHPGKNGCPECIRALLCRNCNITIGRFEDNPDVLEAAARYLRHKKRRLGTIPSGEPEE